VRQVRSFLALRTFVCLLALAAACEPAWRHRGGRDGAGTETWIVARAATVAQEVSAPGAPALAVRPAGTTGVPDLLPVTGTSIAATVVGPIATVERTKRYAAPAATVDAFIAFTPPATPARQDWTVRLGSRTFAILVREPAEARALAREQTGASLVATDAAGRIVVPARSVPATALELVVESTGIVPWRDGAYELTVPRAPAGDVAFVADMYGPGPIVVVSSPSHAIDVVPESIEHVRVSLREPGTLHEDAFVLRYRVDSEHRPGAFVVVPDGGSELVAVVVHPIEEAHEVVAASDVTIDWNGSHVTEMRPATIDAIAAGTPLVVLARAQGAVAGPITIHARVGRQTRNLVLTRVEAVPSVGLRALASLWARTVRVAVARR
jgi:hypothetical protein